MLVSCSWATVAVAQRVVAGVELESEFAQACQREARAFGDRHRRGPILGHPDRQLRHRPVRLADDQDDLIAVAAAAPDFYRCAAPGVEAVADHHLARLIVGIMKLPRPHRARSSAGAQRGRPWPAG
jgi:hypothetical protein